MKMMRTVTIVVALFCAGAVVADARAEVTPVQKVIDLMDGMLAKGKEEKHAEQVQFAAYKQWCDDTSAAKAASIKEATQQIAILKADVAKAQATADELTKEIADLDEDISVWKGDITAATKVREIEKGDYDKTHDDYSESIDALENAIAVLKKQDYDREQAEPESFIQVQKLNRLKLIPETAKKTIDLFLAQGMNILKSGDYSAMAAPEANAYEFQSGGVIAMLDKLLSQFTEERTDLEKEEMNSKHAYQMLIADLEAAISKADTDSTKKSEDKAQELQLKADAEGDKEQTEGVLAADTKYKSDTDATCEQKESDFEARQALRAEELEAIAKAISIIAGESVTGNADTYLPSMLQTTQRARAPALAMLRAASSSQVQTRVAEYLRKQATHLNSRLLAGAAERISADPFEKVKKLIKDLIVRLMNEATEEAEHKGWCDTEMASNAHTRKEKSDAVDKLKSEIDQLTASIAKLGEDIAELTQAVADLDAAMAKATKMRAEEKEKNEQTVSDSQEAQAAVSQALLVLKDFYSKAAEATAFVQKTKQPEIFEGAYTGMQDENGGVIGMLEVIDSDFARLESDTKAAEASALKEYEEFMEDSNIDKTAKTKDIEFKTTKKQDESSMLVSKKGDLENTQAELDEALTYFDKLKPSCVDADVSYEDRVARRQQEIESLQEALKILNGEA
mmetsp:Transcript_112516/g.206490  ORF Transcript_112516/g.206490 Transcript_112516/m.206490 type:complete len:682 (+) Transcript_112516:56-2101(+)